MVKWLQALFGKKGKSEAELALEGEVQNLRLDLAEQEQLVTTLKQELERQRSESNTQVVETVHAQIEQLLTATAAPVAQLLTQAHLLEVAGKPVQARDVLAVSKRFIRILEDHGLSMEGNVGQNTSFDPDRHEPLQANTPLPPQQPVVVRFVGVAYQGKLIRKAGVTQVEE